MPVTYDDWLQFVKGGPVPDLPPEVASAWMRCREETECYFDRIRLPRLSTAEFNDRCHSVRWLLAKLDYLVAKAKYRFDGYISFTDADCYQLYCEQIGRESRHSVGARSVGCLLSEDLVGNMVNNMTLKHRRHWILAHYEHMCPLLHGQVGYGEPIVVDGKIIGSMAVYIRTQDRRGVTMAYNVARTLIEACLAVDKKPASLSSGKRGLCAKYRFEDMVCLSDEMKDVREKSFVLSKSDHPILIFGESGTGKELLAQSIHNASHRAHRAFVAVNCAAFAENLVTSELFGYSEGAFTGAVKGGKQGKFEIADQGTIFLDEVGDLALPAQAMLLRTLQEQQVTRIGDDQTISVDFRVISATNKNLRQMCAKGLFRWDLYYRLAGAVLVVPPLRERRGCVATIVQHFLAQINAREYGAKGIAPDAVRIMERYHWPGNIRELKNMLETAYLLSPGNMITTHDVADLLRAADPAKELDASESDKKSLFLAALAACGRVSEAAERAQVSRATAYRWRLEAKLGSTESTKHTAHELASRQQ